MTAVTKTRPPEATHDDDAPDEPGVVETATVPEPKKQETAAPLIDLDANERERIRFGGKFYELRTINEFGVGKQHRLNRHGREFHELFSSPDELSEDSEQRLEMLVEELFEDVFIGPKTVKQKLSGGQKSQIILAFILAPLARSAALMQVLQQLQSQDQEARNGDPITGS